MDKKSLEEYLKKLDNKDKAKWLWNMFEKFERAVSELKKTKFETHPSAMMKVYALANAINNHDSNLKIDKDGISLYQNGYINEDTLCIHIISYKINRFIGQTNIGLDKDDEYIKDITEFIKDEFDISLDEFLLKNFKLIIKLRNEEPENFKTLTTSLNPHMVNYQEAIDQICLFFVRSFGMEEFIRRFSNFKNFSFLKTINLITIPPNLNFGRVMWNNRGLDNILMEYIYRKKLVGRFLTKECELNYLPNIPALFLKKTAWLGNVVASNNNKPQILISSTIDDLSNFATYDVAFNYSASNIVERQCVFQYNMHTPNLIHICFYNVSYEDFYEALKLCNFNNLKWNKFIHLNDSVLHINEDEGITSYPKFYQLLIGNSLKFKNLVTNILHFDSGIDHYAITSGNEHKEWLNNFPFDNEDLRFRFKRENLDITFNDFFRRFVEIDEHPNLEQNNGLVNDLFFYKIK